MKTQTKLFSIALAFILVLAISASALTISSVSSSPSEIAPGQRASISFNLENNFEDGATDISVKLNLDSLPIAPYGSGAERTIDRIKTEKSKGVEFEVSVSSTAQSQTYKIPVSISYKSNNQALTKTDFISLIVRSKPQIIALSSDILIKGRENTLNVKVINNGLENVKFLNVKMLPVSGIRMTSSNEAYIGDLNSDDSDTAEFKFFINNDVSVSSFPVEISYTDSATKEYTSSFQLTNKVYSKEEALSLGLITKSRSGIYIGIIVIVVLVFIFSRIRKRRRKREE